MNDDTSGTEAGLPGGRARTRHAPAGAPAHVSMALVTPDRRPRGQAPGARSTIPVRQPMPPAALRSSATGVVRQRSPTFSKNRSKTG